MSPGRCIAGTGRSNPLASRTQMVAWLSSEPKLVKVAARAISSPRADAAVATALAAEGPAGGPGTSPAGRFPSRWRATDAADGDGAGGGVDADSGQALLRGRAGGPSPRDA